MHSGNVDSIRKRGKKSKQSIQKTLDLFLGEIFRFSKQLFARIYTLTHTIRLCFPFERVNIWKKKFMTDVRRSISLYLKCNAT